MLKEWLDSLFIVVVYPLMLLALIISWVLPGAIVTPIVYRSWYKKGKWWLALCPYFVTWLREKLK